MENLELIELIEKKLDEIYTDSENGLKNLSERYSKMYPPVETCFEVDESYYRNVARFAWGFRGSQIATFRVRGLLNELKKLENGNGNQSS